MTQAYEVYRPRVPLKQTALLVSETRALHWEKDIVGHYMVAGK